MHRSSVGYMVRGMAPIGRDSLPPRGDRISALCSFDSNGFVAWSFVGGTFNREQFLTAAQHVVVRSSR